MGGANFVLSRRFLTDFPTKTVANVRACGDCQANEYVRERTRDGNARVYAVRERRLDVRGNDGHRHVDVGGYGSFLRARAHVRALRCSSAKSL